ncbi:phosphodiester glycosidase family protein [Actinomadura rayongensis]|uniref:phosphodiester glycosidase family protein n=1 Tax=Actinomadura rayongensis TaxID=1429076 RepID=UPI001926933D
MLKRFTSGALVVVVGGAAPAWGGGPPSARTWDGAGSGERPDARRTVTSARAVVAPRYTAAARIAPGAVLRTFETSGSAGKVRGVLVEVDLRERRVRLGLLHPPAVAARRTVSAMAASRRAVAGINGDFFDITTTGASNGPEIDDGRPLKAAVPDGQRFGPQPPPAATTEDVLGVSAARRAYVTRLHLTGSVRSGGVQVALRGLNQYALPVGGAGAFTSAWGTASRRRAVCGTDSDRRGPCSSDTAEVAVRGGRVVTVKVGVGGGAIPAGTTVLVGRDGAARSLRKLRPGDRVSVGYRLTGPHKLRFAVGGFPILRDGAPSDGLVPGGAAPRTAAGVSRDGRRVYLVVVDGRSEDSGGLTLGELSALLARAGADDAVNLDGGGSSALVARAPGARGTTVRNHPSDGSERAVANGIGVFTR